MQNARVTAFTISELLRETQQVGEWGRVKLSHPHPGMGKLVFLILSQIHFYVS